MKNARVTVESRSPREGREGKNRYAVMDYKKTMISLGGGVQSLAMGVCSTLGLHDVPRADLMCFADTGDEAHWTYEAINKLKKWSDIEVRTIGLNVSLSENIRRGLSGGGRRYSTIPGYTLDPDTGSTGIQRRNCSPDYKIKVLEREYRKEMGYKPRQRIKEVCRVMIGFSVDEASRMKPDDNKWVHKVYPLVDARLRRSDCVKIVEEHLGFTPMRSACIFCPFHDDNYWRSLKRNHPDLFAKAVDVDVLIRDQSIRKLKSSAFLHRSLKPLSEVDFHDERQTEMWGDPFDNDCGGICGI